MSKKIHKTFEPSEYYCHSCSVNNFDFYPSLEKVNLSSSVYQLGKYIKHTIPNTVKKYCTVYYEEELYYNFINTVIASGSIEKRNGQYNVVYIYSYPVGYAMKNGVLVHDKLNLVKVVNFTNPEEIHHFCSGSAGAIDASCKICGQKVFDYLPIQSHLHTISHLPQH